MRAGLSYVCLSFVVAVLLPSSLHGTGIHFMKGGQCTTGSKSSCTPSCLGSVARTGTAGSTQPVLQQSQLWDLLGAV